MSDPTIEAAAKAAPPAPVANPAWFLHSAGRVFGPLDEGEMRGYFRAGMVKAGDSIAVAGQVGTVSAIEAALLLGEAAPAPSSQSSAAPVKPTSIVVRQVGEKSNAGKLVALLVLVAVIGAGYFALHTRPEAQPASAPVAAHHAESAAPAPVEAQATDAPSRPAYDPFTANPMTAADTATPTATPVAAAAPSASPAQFMPQEPTPGSGGDDWWNEATRLKDGHDWVGLQAHAQKWTQAQPRRDLAWWYLGVAQYWQGNYAGTIESANKALELSPRYVKARWLLSDAYIRTQQWRKSLDILNELVDEMPNEAGVWNDIGIDQSNLGEYDDAVQALEKAVKLDPTFKLAWENLAQAYAHFGQLDKARAAVDKVNSLRD